MNSRSRGQWVDEVKKKPSGFFMLVVKLIALGKSFRNEDQQKMFSATKH